jgi:ubiquinone/menaquinone biosynthesis C-methylase UbiE
MAVICPSVPWSQRDGSRNATLHPKQTETCSSLAPRISRFADRHALCASCASVGFVSSVSGVSQIDPDVLAYYSEHFREDDRLRVRAHGVLERVRTQELIARFLPPPPANILDVGGGTGVHAEWLAGQGYHVRVVDPVPTHVAHAQLIPGVSAEVGDARSLNQADDSQDVVLLLGPLYHLLDREDRLTALREARRVARPNAPVLAAGISRYTALMDIGSDGRLTEDLEPFLLRIHETGEFRGDVIGFTTAYFHMPAELRQEMTDAGLSDSDVFGIEGPAGPTLRALGADCLEQRLDAAVRAARLVESDPHMLAASGHLLAVGLTPA